MIWEPAPAWPVTCKVLGSGDMPHQDVSQRAMRPQSPEGTWLCQTCPSQLCSVRGFLGLAADHFLGPNHG